MKKRSETCALIREIGIVPAVRLTSAEEAHFAAEAVASGGIPIVEITLTVTGASNFSGGTQSGSGTTLAQVGARDHSARVFQQCLQDL